MLSVNIDSVSSSGGRRTQIVHRVLRNTTLKSRIDDVTYVTFPHKNNNGNKTQTIITIALETTLTASPTLSDKLSGRRALIRR